MMTMYAHKRNLTERERVLDESGVLYLSFFSSYDAMWRRIYRVTRDAVRRAVDECVCVCTRSFSTVRKLLGVRLFDAYKLLLNRRYISGKVNRAGCP